MEKISKESLDLRNEIKLYIRNERDTVLKKWMALEEQMKSEDDRREQFLTKQLRNQEQKIPIYVTKLIGNLKKSVHNTMRDKGGSPGSILKQMFVSFDRTRSGYLTEHDFKSCIYSLGLLIDEEELKKIYNYYSTMNPKGLSYMDILADINANEPSVIQTVDHIDEDDDKALRYKSKEDEHKIMPEKVKFFVEALRDYCARKMRTIGGTPHSHIRKIFLGFDFDYSCRLNANELHHASRRMMKLDMSMEDCQAVVSFYDRGNTGEMSYHELLHDVTDGMRSFLSFVEHTPEELLATRKRLAINPYFPIEFKPRPNRLLESVKNSVHQSLALKMRDIGGSYKSWIADTFQFWDPRDTGFINSIDHLRGVFKRLGVNITAEEANNIMNCYDPKKTGKLEHKYLARDLLDCQAGNDVIPTPAVSSGTAPTSATGQPKAIAKAPHAVIRFLKSLWKSLKLTTKQSRGVLKPNDILHGTFVRYDPADTGRVNATDLVKVGALFHITLSPADAAMIVTWFDSNGTNLLDYNKLVQQLYNESDDIFESSFLEAPLTESQLLPFLEGTKVGRSLAAKVTTQGNLFPGVEDHGNESKIKGLARLLHLDDPSYSTPFLPNATLTSSTTAFSTFNKSSSDRDATLKKAVESRAIKEVRRQMVRTSLLDKKRRVEHRLAEVDEQRKDLLVKYGHKIRPSNSGGVVK